MYYLDPKNDITFKKVFGQHPNVLKSFLNALLPLEADGGIVEIEYLTPELLPDIPELKLTIVDIRCRDKQGRQFLVEMQMLWADSFESRVLFNSCKAFSKQISRGDAYGLLAPVYALNIVNQSFSGQAQIWCHHYRLRHQSLPERYIRGLEIVSVELPNFMPHNYTARKMTTLWLRFLKNIENQTTMIPAELLEVPEIAEAVDALKITSYTNAELEQYDRYWDIVRTQKSMLLDAERKGKLEGKLEGERHGKLEGKLETLKHTAQKLIAKGFSDNDIADITDLSLSQIEALRQNFN